MLAVGLAALSMAPGVSATDNSFRIDLSGQTASRGSEFTVRVIENATVDTSGAQASVTFDHAILQITSVNWGAPYADAPIHVPTTMAVAIAGANESGKLAQLAAAFGQPANVPPGDADFLVIGFKAIGCGTVSLGLPVGPVDAALLDGRPTPLGAPAGSGTYGNSLPVTSTGATITIGCAAGGSSASTVSGSTAPTGGGGLPPAPFMLAAAVLALAALFGVLLIRRSGRGTPVAAAIAPSAPAVDDDPPFARAGDGRDRGRNRSPARAVRKRG